MARRLLGVLAVVSATLLAACSTPPAVTITPGQPSSAGAAPVGLPKPSPPPPAKPGSSPAPIPEPSPEPSPEPGSTAEPTDLSGTNYGYVTGYDAARSLVTVDLAYYLTGQQAKDYVKARQSLWPDLPCDGTLSGHYEGGDDSNCFLLGDYYLINDNPKLRTLTTAPDVAIKLVVLSNCCAPLPATAAQLLEALQDSGDHKLLMKFEVGPGGFVTELAQMYQP